jgi:hypothetical protein
VLVEPAPCLVIEYDGELVHHAIMRQAGPRTGLASLTNDYRTAATAGMSCSTTS